MARYQPAIDIWKLTSDQRKALPIGQWVYCGDPRYIGQFFGETGRTTVVAHYGGHERGWPTYRRAIRDYARSPQPSPLPM